jgi:hypothetical protein
MSDISGDLAVEQAISRALFTCRGAPPRRCSRCRSGRATLCVGATATMCVDAAGRRDRTEARIGSWIDPSALKFSFDHVVCQLNRCEGDPDPVDDEIPREEESRRHSEFLRLSCARIARCGAVTTAGKPIIKETATPNKRLVMIKPSATIRLRPAAASAGAASGSIKMKGMTYLSIN